MYGKLVFVVGAACLVLFIVVLSIKQCYHDETLANSVDVTVNYEDRCDGKVYIKTFRFWDVKQRFRDPETNVFDAVMRFSRTHNVINQKHVYFEMLPWLSYIELVVCEEEK